ncbi:general stress protein [Bacillus sp. JCM 19046]|uniref:Uncharacterized protein YoxC n=1 Tax=Shouchella xiaoxiensis TaxID=766895 RepID=A0ABS2SWR6_9BACI|nr:DUF948 domain-containing protein [Shouchella xiaoxiensis]MBM7839977.1 uncharacterized protein YoxC [Shouchella xiaoxiensis]GAF12663.1 general stress protein [Bacillus sp. JCM 19045]GAF17773.1 general stress protein [Bacillus sp. JCM 19046]
MDWIGIGVFVLAIGFLVAVIFLIPALNNLAKTLDKTASTVAQVEKSLDEITGEVKVTLYNANETLMDVNGKVAKLDPLFDIIHDSGEAAHRASSALSTYTSTRVNAAKQEAMTAEPNQIHGIIKSLAFLYYFRKAKKKQNQPPTL